MKKGNLKLSALSLIFLVVLVGAGVYLLHLLSHPLAFSDVAKIKPEQRVTVTGRVAYARIESVEYMGGIEKAPILLLVDDADIYLTVVPAHAAWDEFAPIIESFHVDDEIEVSGTVANNDRSSLSSLLSSTYPGIDFSRQSVISTLSPFNPDDIKRKE